MFANILISPEPMHIPDGFLSAVLALILWGITVIVIAIALKRTRASLGERQAPLMGVLAAAIFAGQMLNFAVAGGTSGHLMGAALATILLGPWPAILVMTVVVGVQALIFQDGGLLVLGANIFNMGIIGVAVSYFVYSTARRLLPDTRLGLLASGFTAGWSSIFLAALAVALQLAVSGMAPANLTIPAMGGIHALIGIGEGLITVGALALVLAARPDLLAAGEGSSSGRGLWVAGLALAVTLAVLSPLASSHPDGLEWVAEQQGFLSRAVEPTGGIIPDYTLPGISNQALATISAGIIGVLLVFGVTALVSRNRQRIEQQDR